MGEVPMERVTPSSPFTMTGVYFAGPIILCQCHVRTPSYTKTYLCVIVCISTKAVHLELVHNTFKADFTAAMRWLNASPWMSYTNVVRQWFRAHQLGELYSELKSGFNTISVSTTSKGIEWKCIPAHAPHFGGIWEAAVKATNRLICKTIG